MKTLRIVTLLALVALVVGNTGCKKNDITDPSGSILPTAFKVDIPDAISFEGTFKNGTNKTSTYDTLRGNDIYEHMGTFIHVGEEAADIVQHIIFAISLYGIDQAMTLSYVSDDDNRTKNLEVIEGSTYDGVNWEFQLTITDALSTGNPDGGKGLQIFWNRSPIKGIAILKPYNLDRVHDAGLPDMMARIDYSEAGEFGYGAHMIVSINGLPLENPLVDPYSMSTMKMFVGASGATIDLYGNSDHPNANFFNNNTGFNWAFVASGNDALNIGAAEVGLPPSGLDEDDRTVLLEDNSIKEVFEQQIYDVWPGIDPNAVDAYLFNTDPPGYFNNNGFMVGGTSPSQQHTVLANRLPNLTPYNPDDMAGLQIDFKP